jgi:hypothetical protein
MIGGEPLSRVGTVDSSLPGTENIISLGASRGDGSPTLRGRSKFSKRKHKQQASLEVSVETDTVRKIQLSSKEKPCYSPPSHSPS